MTTSDGAAVTDRVRFADETAGIEAARRLDGPTDTIRAKFSPRTPRAASRLREELSVRHDFGRVLTATVNGSHYRSLAADENVVAAPVQRVRLAQSSDIALTVAEPTEDATLSGTVEVTVEADAGFDDVEADADGGSGTNDTEDAPSPSVTWVSPTDGADVQGETTLEFTAAASNGDVQSVGWRVDGGRVRGATKDAETDTYRATWNASTVEPGGHTLTAAATGDNGTTSTAAIGVSVSDETTDGSRADGDTGNETDGDAGNETAGGAGNETDSGTGNETDESGGDSGDGSDGSSVAVAWHSPEDGATVEDTIPVRLSGPAPADGRVRWRVDGGPARETSYDDETGRWTAAWNASTAAAGTHSLTARATDGNGSVATATVNVTVPTSGHPPTIWWQSPVGGTTVRGEVRLQLDAGDPDGSVEAVYWGLDGGERRQARFNATSGYWEANLDAAAVGTGDHVLRAVAVDGAGRTSAPTRIDVVADGGNHAPTVDWLAPAADETVEGTVELRIDAADTDGTVESVAYQVDDGRPETAERDPMTGEWVATWDADAADDGSYTLRTRAIDDDGATANATVSVSVDSTTEAPDVTIEHPDDGDTVSGVIDLRVAASDPDGTIERTAWAVDRGDRRPLSADGSGTWSATIDTTELSNGEHEIHAGAEDDQGARSGTSVTVTVDNGPSEPTVRWDSPADGATVDPQAVPIRIHASAPGDSIAQVRWQVDRSAPQSAEYDAASGDWKASVDASNAPPGDHRLRARARTEDGETAQAAITVSVAGDGSRQNDSDRSSGRSLTSPSRTPYGVRQVLGKNASASGGEGVDVAVIDTGVDTDHPALADALAACVDLRATGSCEDRNGHGTHLAGVVAGAGGDDGPRGVAPNATLHAYKAVAANGTGYADDVAAAIHRAAERDVEIVVLGLRSEARGSLVERAMAAHRDELVVVAAAGNGGPSLESIASPAAAEGAIAVGAIDRDRRVRASSGRGAAGEFCDCGNRLELVAAGEDVVSTWPGGDYRRLSGTSIAAPHVAGLAARLWASGAADRNGDGTVTPAEVRATLRSQAEDVTDGQAAGPGYDPASGAGLPVLP